MQGGPFFLQVLSMRIGCGIRDAVKRGRAALFFIMYFHSGAVPLYNKLSQDPPVHLLHLRMEVLPVREKI